jgi:uncharacterized protein
MITPNLELARRFVDAEGAPSALCVGVTGAHAYGFASRDSDLDLKGIHAAPTAALLGLVPPGDTVDRTVVFEGVEVDYTSHEVGFALRLLAKGNGNMLERILTPFQVVPSAELEALQELARGAVSRRFHRHYRGFFGRVQEECRRAAPKTAKGYLYAYRSALTGIHLLRTGACVMDVGVLAPLYGFEAVPELLARKREGAEQEPAPRVARWEADWPRLEAGLETALGESALPEAPDLAPLSDFLVEVRRRRF